MSNESTTPVWHVHHHDLVESTNDLAGQLPGWHAVVAARQTSGRGRYRRTWVSDAGGLWLSAVLPTPGPADRWAILPLAAGWALREMLATLGVAGTRLRWPNDLMIGPAKLAGILVERFNPATAVIGIGINYTNDPAAADPDLAGRVTRLADLVQPLPPREAVLATLLAHLAQAQQRIAAGGLSQLLPTLNTAWHTGRVTVTLHPPASTVLHGTFHGVTETGDLILHTDDAHEHILPPLDVALLRED